MKDFMGIEVQVGDVIQYNSTEHSEYKNSSYFADIGQIKEIDDVIRLDNSDIVKESEFKKCGFRLTQMYLTSNL